MTEQVTIALEDFFQNEYVDFSKYDNVRKIASYIDGQKNAARKILHTVIQQNINKFVKVSNLGPKVQDFAQYLHGSLEGTVVNMTADYVGSGNNIPLLQGDGNFGSAFINDAAATRYIYARASDSLKNLFNPDDYPLLEEQSFEGAKIEPRFYMPTLPLILINGSEGVSVGFAQKILPRNPKEIVKWVRDTANGKKSKADLTPYWEGMACTVEQGETKAQWLIKGSFTRKTKHRITIDALPIGYDLKQYHAVLDKLTDDKVIKGYDDLSDNDVFSFEIQVDGAFGAKPDDWIMDKLKLIKKVTENYTCTDENNNVIIFDSVEQILDAWYTKRIKFNELRKTNNLAIMNEKMDDMNAKAKFILGVVTEEIELRNVSEDEIIKMATKFDSVLKDRAKKYLGLPMRTLTVEEIEKLQAASAELRDKIAEYEKLTLEEITLADCDSW